MSWRYDRYQSVVTNVTTGATFSVKGNSPEELQIEPINPPASGWSEGELEEFRAKTIVAVQDEVVRSKMEGIIRQYFRGAYLSAAQIISNKTGKKISQRSIQSWLIDPSKSSSRKCPSWALKALEEYVSMNPEISERQRKWEEEQSRQRTPGSWSREVEDSKSVGFAENDIEADETMRKKWAKSSLGELHEHLYQLEKKHDEHLWYLNGLNSHVTKALKEASNFEEFKATFFALENESKSVDYIIREARTAIETGKDEFSNDEGVL